MISPKLNLQMTLRTQVIALIVVASFAVSVTTYTSLTASQVSAAKTDLTNLYKNNGSMIATTVRLSFHDCVGGCDGCINQNNSANAGLVYVIENINALWTASYSTIMSRADFWGIAGIAAIELGIKRANRNCVTPDCMPDADIVFKWGRVDCSTDGTTTEVHSFPEPTMDYSTMMTYFDTEFGFNPQQVTALMGAHTLGFATAANSGYAGPWVNGEVMWFDNNFYKLINDGVLTYTQKDVKFLSGSTTEKWQWIGRDSNGTRTSMMLNTDIELYKLLVLDSNGKSSCDLTTCSDSDTKAYFADYSASKTNFMTAFREVYQLMQAHGSTALNDVSA